MLDLLGTSMKPLLAFIPAMAKTPTSLSSTLCRPTSSRSIRTSPLISHHAAACMEPVMAFNICPSRIDCMAARMAVHSKSISVGIDGIGRMTLTRLSVPQMPQPVRLTRVRLRFKNAKASIQECQKRGPLGSVTPPVHPAGRNNGESQAAATARWPQSARGSPPGLARGGSDTPD